MHKQVCQKPAHFLSVQIPVLIDSSSVFIILGMYNFGIVAALNAFAAFCTKISNNMFLLQCGCCFFWVDT